MDNKYKEIEQRYSDSLISIDPYEPNNLSPERWAYLNRPYADRNINFEEWISKLK